MNGLTLNEDRREGGIMPRTDINGRWLPPIYHAGYGSQHRGTVYRWSDGEVSAAPGYHWTAGYDRTPNGNTLGLYKATTLFWCNPFDQFMAMPRDATGRDMDEDDRWFPINFYHEGALSRLDYAANQCLAGAHARFIPALGLASYAHPADRAPVAGSLAGDLALLLGLVAFACRWEDLDRVLVAERAWRDGEWRGHAHATGRESLLPGLGPEAGAASALAACCVSC